MEIDQELNRIFLKLSSSERNLIYKRFGILTKKVSVNDLCKEYNVTKQRISQKEEAILKKIVKFSDQPILEIVNKIRNDLANNLILLKVEYFKEIKTKFFIDEEIIHLLIKAFKVAKIYNEKKITYAFLSSILDMEIIKKNYKEIYNTLLKFNEPISIYSLNKEFNPDTISAVVKIYKNLIILDEKIYLVSKLNYWSSRTLQKLIEIYLTEEKSPIHFKKIHKLVCEKISKQYSVKTIHLLLTGNEFLFCGKGKYSIRKPDSIEVKSVTELIIEILNKEKQISRDKIKQYVLTHRNDINPKTVDTILWQKTNLFFQVEPNVFMLVKNNEVN